VRGGSKKAPSKKEDKEGLNARFIKEKKGNEGGSVVRANVDRGREGNGKKRA